MKKLYWIIGAVIVAALIFVLASVNRGVLIPTPDYTAAYRLVPEKISRSAAISVSVPDAPSSFESELGTRVAFNPPVAGKWVTAQDAAKVSLISTAEAASKIKTYYYQPIQELEENRHIAVTVTMPDAKVMTADFLVVPDPEIVSILPADGEVLPNTKISIVFNRPMVPLSTLAEMTPENIPVSITPQTPGRFKWISTNTLQFIPEKELISSAEYTVTVGEGLKSMEGIPVKPKKGTFSTYHLRYSDTSPEAKYESNVIRGYNQPFLIRFNQPIDLNRTSQSVVVVLNGNKVPFTAAYWKTKKGNQIKTRSFLGNVYNSLFKAAASDTEEEIEDTSMLAIYPAGGEKGTWEPDQVYTVIIEKAYPLSGGSIIIDKRETFAFQVDDILSDISVRSPRGQTTVNQFDPMGSLVLRFYEDINIDGSKITAPHMDKVEYGTVCSYEHGSPCVDTEDKKMIVVTFKADSFKKGDSIPVRLERIVSSDGRQLTSKGVQIDLKVYSDLQIYKVTAGDSLSNILFCTNNPIRIASTTEQKFSSSFGFEVKSWNTSYVSSGISSGCEAGQFVTYAYTQLVPSARYNGSVSLLDSFGTVGSKNADFYTRSLRQDDYGLESYQEYTVVSVPDKTKLSYAARYLPDITVTICKLGAYEYSKAVNNPNGDSFSCQGSVSKKIPLPSAPQSIFSVDIKDYYSNPVGNYLVSLSSPFLEDSRWRYQNRTLISVTNLIVTEKKITPRSETGSDSKPLTAAQLGNLQNLYWVIDATTREPVPGATINIYKNGAVVSAASTNASGVAFINPVENSEATVVTLGSDSVAVSGGNSPISWADSATNLKRLYMYTDKPIYRPGQDVNIKGIYRVGYDGIYTQPLEQTLPVTVYDSANKVISEQKLPVSSYGTVATKVTLNSEVPLGSYRACVQYRCAYFDVLNYAPAAFRVAFDEGSDEISPNDQPAVKLKADYYFGVPLSDASVEYRVSSQYYNFEKFTGGEYYSFNNIFDEQNGSAYYYGDRYLGRGEATLDEKGEATIRPDLSSVGKDTSKIIIIDATVKNQEGRSIGAQKSFILHAAPVYIGSQIKNSFAPVGQKLPLKIKTVDTEGKAVNFGSLKVETYKVKWESTKYNDSYYSWKRTRELVHTDSVRTNKDGEASIEVGSTSEGEYEVEVASSNKGAAVGSRTWFYSYGQNAVPVRASMDRYLEVKSSTEKLNTGDTGEVVFEVPEGSAKALITLERGRIFTYEVVDVKGSIGHYSFPVTADHYPNVYVSVVAYPPAHEVRIGNKNFVVNSDQKKITLKVSADKKEYNPGDTVALYLSATDDSGRPVVSEVSLAVVDMSILALRGNPKQNPMSEFYGYVPLTVATYSNFSNLLKYVELSKAGGGKGGSGGDPNSSKRRGVFKEVAYWNPTVITDVNGRATVSFTLPDNLTTWRTEALAVTRDTKLGVAYDEFTTNKTLMLTPLKPRFAVPGDSFMMGATIFNRGASALDGSVTLRMPGIDLPKNTAQSISLKSGESKTVYWDAKVPHTASDGIVEFSIDVAGSGLNDAVDDVLIVRPNTTYEAVATAGQTTSSQTEIVYIPESISKDRGELTLRSSATLAVFMTDALQYVIEYPYSFTEQIASRLSAAALVKRALTIPNVTSAKQTVKFNDKEYTIDQFLQEGLQTLYSRQNADGGFSYWTGSSQSNYWSTKRALQAFRILSESGIAIDESRAERSAAYVYNEYVTYRGDMAGSEFIDLASALFTRPSYRSNGSLNQKLASVVRQILGERKTPSAAVLDASVLLHRYNLYPELSSQLDQVLRNKVVIDSRGSFLDITSGDCSCATPVSNTAGYINLLSMRRADDQSIPGMMRWLLASRDKEGAWGSQKNTLSVIEAMTTYLKWQPETSASFSMKNTVNEKPVQEFSFTPSTILSELTKTLPLADLKSGELNAVTFAKTDASQNGKIYYDMSLKYFLSAPELPPRDEGFTITRGMYSLTDEKNETILNKVKMGDVVRERIEVTVPVTRKNVLIEDFIPAGMEIVDTSLTTEDQTLEGVEAEVKNNYLWPSHKEIRDDRYVMVIDELRPGTYEFNYFIRALVPGTYTHLPARAGETYNPENFGRTETGLFTIEK